MKDLFEYYNEQPPELKTICDSWSDRINDGLDYKECKQFLQEVEKIGFTFDYYLDAEPYNLRPLMTANEIESLKEKHEKLRSILMDYGSPEYGDCIIDEICELFETPPTTIYYDE